ncbi:hypothetical protein HYV71_01800 [Candidatus Uhrbacteria bacterium]|nr:hypothetical protein [Candidatus Uhrbacteria bacterium]
MTTINQWLETGLVVGYLIGTYRIGKDHADGYLWFVLMHVAAGCLMYVQGYPWLVLQQAVSLIFIGLAYKSRQEWGMTQE